MSTRQRLSAARIYDGVSTEPFSGHIVMTDGVITAVIRTGVAGQKPESAAVAELQVITNTPDAAIVAPGFIDLHSHSDFSLLARRDAPSKLAQGVTTEVVGNCGFSVFPEPSYWIEPKDKYGLASTEYFSAGAYLDEVSSQGRASNIATLVGAGAVRAAVVGNSSETSVEPRQIAEMRRLLLESLEQGAIGISYGLFYQPGCYASLSELVGLLDDDAFRSRSMLCAMHLREESTHLIASIDEALEIAQKAGVALHISHFKGKGRKSWGTIGNAIERLEHAGFPVTVDVYPYEASMTRIDTLIPHASGRNFHNGELPPEARASLSRAIEESAYEREGDDAWERIVIAYLPSHRDLERKTIREAASMLGVPAGETVVEIARASQGRAEIISHCLSRADVDAVVSLPYAAIASDGYALPIDAFGALPHPRSFGTFPRFLRRYVIEEKTLSMGNAIKKITSLPAEIAGLPQVGRLAVGCRADMVVIDPSTLRDMADYTRPTQLPVGILDVIVGGQRMTINETGVASPAGKVLTRP